LKFGQKIDEENFTCVNILYYTGKKADWEFRQATAESAGTKIAAI